MRCQAETLVYVRGGFGWKDRFGRSTVIFILRDERSGMDFEQASLTPGTAKHTPEGGVVWSDTEGQAVNAGVFLLALLTFWLVVPLLWAIYRFLRTATTRYTLTDQRLIVQTGIIVKRVEMLELYRVKDISVGSTLLLTCSPHPRG